MLFNWTKLPRKSFDLSNVNHRLTMTGRLVQGFTISSIDEQLTSQHQKKIRDLVLSITKTGV